MSRSDESPTRSGRAIPLREVALRDVRYVRTLVLRQGMRLALAGCAIGTATALLGTRALGSMLHEVSPTDPLTLLSVAAVILAAAALASYLPARRATRVDPVHALRAD